MREFGGSDIDQPMTPKNVKTGLQAFLRSIGVVSISIVATAYALVSAVDLILGKPSGWSENWPIAVVLIGMALSIPLMAVNVLRTHCPKASGEWSRPNATHPVSLVFTLLFLVPLVLLLMHLGLRSFEDDSLPSAGDWLRLGAAVVLGGALLLVLPIAAIIRGNRERRRASSSREVHKDSTVCGAPEQRSHWPIAGRANGEEGLSADSERPSFVIRILGPLLPLGLVVYATAIAIDGQYVYRGSRRSPGYLVLSAPDSYFAAGFFFSLALLITALGVSGVWERRLFRAGLAGALLTMAIAGARLALGITSAQYVE